MRTLRLLFWLRWRIAMNTTTTRGRWAMAGLTALLALVFSPLYLGAAAAAWLYTSKSGASALLVVFGICQLAIVWASLLAGALGRLFELDKLKRYPLRPVDVFAVNTIASLTEPIVLMSIPTLVAATAGVARHSGVLAGVQAAAATLLLLLITAAALQWLLAILDDLLRREWLRYAAAFLFTLTVLAFQLIVGRSSRYLAEQARRVGITPERLLDEVARFFERIPTVSAPASVGGAHSRGLFADPFVSLLVCVVAVALPVWLGSRTMSRAAVRNSDSGRVRVSRGAAATGAFAPRWPGLSRIQSLLAMRELLYLVRTPAVLYQMIVVPLTVVAITLIGRTREAGYGELLPLFVMTSTLAARNLMLWGHDGAGIRSLFLLPFQPRDLVLSKNVVWLVGAFLEAGLAFAALAALRPTSVVPFLPVMITGYAAVTFAGGALGTWVSITRPSKPQERGLSRRGPGGVVGLFAYLAVLVLAGTIVLAVVATRSLAPDAYDDLASLLVTSVAVIVCAALWWLSLERNADELERHREQMIGEIAKTADA